MTIVQEAAEVPGRVAPAGCARRRSTPDVAGDVGSPTAAARRKESADEVRPGPTGPAVPPVIRTVRGEPDAFEVAALTAAILAVAAGSPEPVARPSVEPAAWARLSRGALPAGSWARRPHAAWQPSCDH